MAGYDPKKAAEYNRLIQQGVSPEDAIAQAGITYEEEGNYQIESNPESDNYGRMDEVEGPLTPYPEPTAEELRAAQIADYEIKYPGVPLPTELSGLTENERQAKLWDLKYPGIPAPAELTGQSEEDRQRQLWNISNPGKPYPYDEPYTKNEPIDTDQDYGDPYYFNGQSTISPPPTSSTTVNPASNPSQFPAYDDEGNLMPGYEIDPIDGQAYYSGYYPTATKAATVNPASNPSQFPAYDDEGNLMPGYEIDPIDGQAYYSGYYPTATKAATVNNPYYGLTPEQIKWLGNADPTDPYIRARGGIPQLPGSILAVTAGFGTIKTGVKAIDSALGIIGSASTLITGIAAIANSIGGLFGSKPTASTVASTTGMGVAGLTQPTTTPATTSTTVNPSSDPNQFPAYDDEGNLMPGYEIDPIDGRPYWTGYTPPTTSTTVNPSSDPNQFPMYDDEGNLMPGYELDPEFGQPYWTGNVPNTTQQSVAAPTDYGTTYDEFGSVIPKGPPTKDTSVAAPTDYGTSYDDFGNEIPTGPPTKDTSVAALTDYGTSYDDLGNEIPNGPPVNDTAVDYDVAYDDPFEGTTTNTAKSIDSFDDQALTNQEALSFAGATTEKIEKSLTEKWAPNGIPPIPDENDPDIEQKYRERDYALQVRDNPDLPPMPEPGDPNFQQMYLERQYALQRLADPNLKAVIPIEEDPNFEGLYLKLQVENFKKGNPDTPLPPVSVLLDGQTTVSEATLRAQWAAAFPNEPYPDDERPLSEPGAVDEPTTPPYDKDGNLNPGWTLDDNDQPIYTGGRALQDVMAERAEAVDPSQGPAYDDEGNLQPGWTVDENGDPAYVGGDYVEPATLALAESARPVDVQGNPYDDDGNLMPGWTLDENGDPVYVGGDFVEPATQKLAVDAQNDAELARQQTQGNPYDDEGNLMPGWTLDENNNPVYVGGDFVEPATQKLAVDAQNDAALARQQAQGTPYDDDGNLNPGWTLDENGNPVYVGGDFVEPATAESAAASRQAATLAKAKQQATIQARYKQQSNDDWRFRLSLSPNAKYLYNAGDPGILQPLAATDGIIFPYSPNVTTNYTANYEQYDLIHSNYRGVFYKNSRVGDISIRGTFTAQDTKEAAYLLAVIHFFRSATKMFYGQDGERGTPPPICLLNGLGQYQFSDHPVLISSFNYTLPNDVDYIRTTSANNFGPNMDNRNVPAKANPNSGAIAGVNRLLNAGLTLFAQPQTPAPNSLRQNISNTAAATYVPTKMEIDITCIPVQTRSKVSNQFSLKGFANGDLLKGGFW